MIWGHARHLPSFERSQICNKTRRVEIALPSTWTPEGFGEFYKPAEERLNQLLAELPKLQAEADLLKVNRPSTEDIKAEAQSLYDRWPGLLLDDRRKIAEAVGEKIVIGADGIDITYLCIPSSEELCKNQTLLCESCWNGRRLVGRLNVLQQVLSQGGHFHQTNTRLRLRTPENNRAHRGPITVFPARQYQVADVAS